MDNAVALVQAYLRINGYFTVAEYPILETHGRNAVQMATDIDILAFRFPGAIRQVSGKHSMRNPAILSVALARFGCCDPEHAERTARKLLGSGRAETPEGHLVRIVVFASGGAEERRFQVISLAHVTEFLRSYLREHWEVLHHAQFRDPVLSLLMTLEKAGDGSATKKES
jgi:hypothetical protein